MKVRFNSIFIPLLLFLACAISLGCQKSSPVTPALTNNIDQSSISKPSNEPTKKLEAKPATKSVTSTKKSPTPAPIQTIKSVEVPSAIPPISPSSTASEPKPTNPSALAAGLPIASTETKSETQSPPLVPTLSPATEIAIAAPPQSETPAIADSPAAPPPPAVIEEVTAPTVVATLAPLPTPDTRVKVEGTMSIEFNSRSLTEDEMRENPERAFDRYIVNLSIPDHLRVKGEVLRYAQVISKYLGKEVQPLSLDYNLAFAAPVSGKERSVGAWKGKLTRNPAGLYQLGASSSLQAQAIKDVDRSRGGAFSGSIQGKNPDSDTSVAGTFREYARMLRGRKVSYTAKRVDPLDFKGLSIPAGPLESFPALSITGNLDYDYDTGNWLTNGLTVRYRQDGKDFTDQISGTIRWIEDPKRDQNGKGQYEFNLRFNEAQFSESGSEADYFANASDEEQFFILDSRVPTISGLVKYKDTFSTSGEEEEPTVVASSVYYQLAGEGVRVDQMVSFLKLWLLIVGPVNDE